MKTQSCTAKILRSFSIFTFTIFIVSDFFNASVSSNHSDNARLRWNTQKPCAICDLYNISENSRFIELALIIDNSNSSTHRDTKEIIQLCQNITDEVNILFHPFDIFVALVEVEIWNESKIVLNNGISSAYQHFENYAQALFKKNIDHAQLISSTFENDFIPFNITTKMCDSSIGVIGNHSYDEIIIAKRLFYVLAYTMGIDPRHESCGRINSVLMMAPAIQFYSSPTNGYKWNLCALKSINEIATNQKRFPCLNNEPIKLFNRSVCGNGLLEIGEECDCGSIANNCNSCCDSRICKFTRSVCKLKKCNFVKPKCNGPLCSHNEDDNFCDFQEQCQWVDNKFSKCHSSDDFEWKTYFYIVVTVILLLTALLLLFFICYIIKWCRSRHQCQSPAECDSVRNVNDEAYSASTSIAYFDRSYNTIGFQLRDPAPPLPPRLKLENEYEEIHLECNDYVGLYSHPYSSS